MRLTKVTTRNGDKGYTSLSDGKKVPKTDKRINAMGAVDKLNSVIGWTILESESDLKHDLEKIQNDPTVRQAIKAFDGTLDPESVSPIENERR